MEGKTANTDTDLLLVNILENSKGALPRACSMANCLLSLLIQSSGDIPQSSTSTDNCGLSGLVDGDAVEVTHIDNQMAILAP
jgi:hypothetical protein